MERYHDRFAGGFACISIGKKEGMADRLQQANKLLDLIQKGLSDYLNTKRVFSALFSSQMMNC